MVPVSLNRRLEGLYRENRQGLFTLALSITRSAHLAEDAIHDAFVNMCRAPERPIDDLTAYVFASVRNAAYDLVRQRKLSGLPADSVYLPGGTSPEEKVAHQELLGLAAQHIEQLPDEQREVLILKVHGGLSFKQIAEIVGAPLPTVAARYRRVLLGLREQLGTMV
ncbi:MAG: RNA polymerase sigma factor [Gemmataceae bacterium]